MLKKDLQWSEDDPLISRASWFHGERTGIYKRTDPFGFSYLVNLEKREVPSLINSIRHGLLRAKAPILCYAFWRALWMGAHPLRGRVCDNGLRGQGLIQPAMCFCDDDVPFSRAPPSLGPFPWEDPVRANQASIIRFTDASLPPLPACASFVAWCSSWIPDS